MGLTKRFIVVVVGVSGSPAEAQRSEIGRYRSTSAARQAGHDEWQRLLFVHAPHIDRYRVVVESNGVEVDEVPMPEIPAHAGPGILDETVTPLGAGRGGLTEPEPEPEAEPEAEAEVDAEPDGEPEAVEVTGELLAIHDEVETTGEYTGMAHEVMATGEHPRIEHEDSDLPARSSIVTDEPPDGPVPDEIIERFAAMVQAEAERAIERRAREQNQRA
ncbi:MAG: hypothetical protein EXQ74_07550 [Thermoleophilia bacterium]|nr:hypothetical protein [Thermoleophilia bacterium]